MKSVLFATAFALLGTSAHAIPAPRTQTQATAFLGLTWTFGSSRTAQTPGVTFKVLSTNKSDAMAATAGVTYNFDGTWGCDIGAGYNFNAVTVTGTWDVCKGAPQIGIGAPMKPEAHRRPPS